MTRDEQLRRAFETLADRLRDEVSRHAQSVIDEFAVSTEAEPVQLSDRSRDDGGSERLAMAIRDLDSARTLSGILDTLGSCAAREATQVAVVLVRDGRYVGWQSLGFEPPFDRDAPVELPPDAWVIPLAISGQVVAALYANPDSPTQPPALEILARHAARCLESMTAFKAARAALAHGSAVDGNGPTDEGNADEAVAARRYARLLVSEIKLYYEPEVVAGRRERDLGTRLGGEIARARTLYEQRVPPQIRQHTDYFHDELVRTLANGDATLLQVGT